MAKPSNVIIKLTAKQRQQIRTFTGESHGELMLERAGTKRQPLAVKVAPRRSPIKKRMLARRGVSARNLVKRGSRQIVCIV